jgi:N-methylhydantoinase A
VPRSRTFERNERLAATGASLVALAPQEIELIVAAVRDSAAAAVAVCFLHSYADPIHERAIGEQLRAALAGVYESLSHAIVREYREYERTPTAVMNAYSFRAYCFLKNSR